jgi:hypothetical protein
LNIVKQLKQNKMKHTKGKVILEKGNKWPFGMSIGTEDKYITEISMPHYSTSDKTIEDVLKRDFVANSEAIANAELIAEAFNVTNECGLTPQQLLEQRNELLFRLKHIVYAIDADTHLCSIINTVDANNAINNAQNK